ncbi:hypothetical protein ACEQ8H_007365 [Pleosporales sp. CAS-2024a]
MSTSAPSFVDDGSSFTNRVLYPQHQDKPNRIPSSASASAYSGSYIDDGLDMLPASRPGFGALDPKFHRRRKAKDRTSCWNDDVQKAVAGDIGRSLGGLRIWAGVELKRHREDEEKNGQTATVTVTVPLPRRWGTIVIKDGERVVVVDEEGEFDSGGVEREYEGKRWVKALSTKSLLEDLGGKEDAKAIPSIKESDSESEYENEDAVYENEADVMSPTGFFMTGGRSGWPLREASPMPSKQKSKGSSPIRSPPGTWLAPLSSPTKQSILDSRSVSSWTKHESHRCSKGKRDHDNISTKTYSTYRPAMVEDASDSPSSSKLKPYDQRDKHDAWPARPRSDGSKRSSHQGRSNHPSSSASVHDVKSMPPAMQPAPIVAQNWVSERVQTVSEMSSRKSHSHGSRRTRSRTPSWDGFEYPKTTSDMSVVGTGSEKSRRRRRNHWTDHWGGSQDANGDGWGRRDGMEHSMMNVEEDVWSAGDIRVRERSPRGGWSDGREE